MPFKKGQSGNPAGKARGTTSPNIVELRVALSELLKKRMTKLNARFDECEAKDEIALLLKMVEFILPKATETVTETPKVDFYAHIIDTLNTRVKTG